MDDRLRPVLLDQAGVISRRQVHDQGLAPHDLARLVRRRALTRIHPGVYVDHTGVPSFIQRAWAGVLLCWPAALGDETALRVAEGPGSRRGDRVIHLVVGRERRLSPPPSLRVHRVDGFEERVLWNVGPPRLRYEEAAVDVAAHSASDFTALGELSRAVQSRRTTADRMRRTMERRPRLRRRAWMESVLADVAAGTCSVLEHGYLTKVERPHGLHLGRRQVRDRVGSGVVYRDVLYECGLVVELDGRLFHDTTEQRDRDLDRDLEAAVADLGTIRLGWGQIFERPCWTAPRVATVLRRLGWTGHARRCPRC